VLSIPHCTYRRNIMAKFKKMLMRHIIVIFGIFYGNLTFGQVDENLIRQKVLKNNVVDSVFVFGKWTEKKGDEAHIKYLGQVHADNGESYKVMTSILLWGLAKHATNRILIYNAKNQYLGNYYVYDIDDLPARLENGILIFKNKAECDKSIKTRIDLKHGIPKQIFIRCNGENGDLYNFDNE
jgi:hypothetical protein